MTDATIQEIPLAKLHESPFNKRRTWGDLKELAESMKSVGILEPLLARPKGASFELVFGHRRLKSAKLAELSTAPVMVRELTDDQALEAQAVENLQRTDIHPLEEAEQYEQLMQKLGWSADQIAAKVGKSRAHIYGRLKLLALCPGARKAFADGELSASVALYVARIPDAKLQLECLEELRDQATISAREAFDIIDSGYMLRLGDAPFDRADPDLVPKAGPCTTCPHRTGNQPELFADVKSKDVCTNPPCYESKKKVGIARRLEDARGKGQTVLEGKAAEQALYYWSIGYLKLDDRNFDTPGRTNRQIIKGKDVETTLAIDRDGKVVELVKKDAVARASGKRVQSAAGDVNSYAKQIKAQKQATKRKRVGTLAVVAKVVEAAEKRSPNAGDAFWQLLATLLVEQSDHDPGVEILRRRGAPPEKARGMYDHRGLLKARLKKMSHDEARGLCVELALGRGMSFHSYGGAGVAARVLEVAKYYRLDGAKLASAAVKAAGQAKKKGGKKK